MLLDNEGKKIGSVRDVYVDVENDEPQFATVSEALVYRHLTYVPQSGIQVGLDDLRANVSRAQCAQLPISMFTAKSFRTPMSQPFITTSN